MRNLMVGHSLVLIVLVFYSLSSAGSDVSVPIRADLDYLRALVKRDAEKDAQSSIADGNLRFLGVAGYVVYVPGTKGGRCSFDSETT